MLYEELSYNIISCFIELHRVLGPGLLEKCYHMGLYYEFKANELQTECYVPYKVYHRGNTLGEYFADLLVEGKIIIEVKAVKKLGNEHVRQLLNYLRISKCKVGFLVNFHPCHMEWKRVALSGSD